MAGSHPEGAYMPSPNVRHHAISRNKIVSRHVHSGKLCYFYRQATRRAKASAPSNLHQAISLPARMPFQRTFSSLGSSLHKVLRRQVQDSTKQLALAGRRSQKARWADFLAQCSQLCCFCAPSSLKVGSCSPFP